MTTSTENITEMQVRGLRREALDHGDLRMAMICCHVLEELSCLYLHHEDAHKRAMAEEIDRMPRKQAIADCVRAIAAAEAQQ